MDGHREDAGGPGTGVAGGGGRGLRERHVARTRRAIQEAALGLFATRGFEATTVQEIADAAEVSERTFFRYFPTKADTIAYDIIEPIVVEAFVRAPAHLGATAALRWAVRDVYAKLPPDRLSLERQRQRLVAHVRGVEAITPQKIRDTVELFTDAASRRTGLASTDAAVRAWVGAMLGVLLTSYVAWAASPDASDVIDDFDAALGLLEQGIPL